MLGSDAWPGLQNVSSPSRALSKDEIVCGLVTETASSPLARLEPGERGSSSQLVDSASSSASRAPAESGCALVPSRPRISENFSNKLGPLWLLSISKMLEGASEEFNSLGIQRTCILMLRVRPMATSLRIKLMTTYSLLRRREKQSATLMLSTRHKTRHPVSLSSEHRTSTARTSARAS